MSRLGMLLCAVENAISAKKDVLWGRGKSRSCAAFGFDASLFRQRAEANLRTISGGAHLAHFPAHF